MIVFLLCLLLQAPANPKSSISGTVIDGGAPYIQPLFHARVQLEGASATPIVVRTDEEGRFVFPGLSGGKYRLTVTHDSFIRQTATVAVTAGQDRNDVRFALQFAPTIVGRVKDVNNTPIQGLLVEAMKEVYGPRGDRSVVAVVSAFSDDRGEFHLYWLDPGDYYIRASSPQPRSGSVTEQAASIYAPTYYPGIRDPKEATKFHLKVGSSMSAFDFKLQPSGFGGVRGRVSIEATGIPVFATITLTPAGSVASTQKYEGTSFMSSQGSKDDGSYIIGGVPPGTYVVTARSISGGQSMTYSQKIAIKSMNSINLLLSSGSPVDGQIAVENGGLTSFRSIKVVLESTDPDLPSPEPASVDAMGKFRVSRVGLGDYSLRLTGLTGDAYLKTVMSADADIQAKALRIDYASPAPIRITLGLDGGQLDGGVFDNADHGFEGAKVVLVPDAGRRNLPNQFLVTESADGGRFTFSGIPPGEYKLFAWQSLESNAYVDPSFLDNYESLGVKVTILPKSAVTASSRLIPIE